MCLIIVGCQKNNGCKDYQPISWDTYNSVSTIYYYFTCDHDNIKAHRGETIGAKGYFDETISNIGDNPPWLYLADNIWTMGEDYRHPRISLWYDNDSVTTDYRGKMIYLTGEICYQWTDGDNFYLNVENMDTIKSNNYGDFRLSTVQRRHFYIF